MMGISYGGISQLFTAAAPPAVTSRRSRRCRCSTPPRRRSTRAASSTPASRSSGRRSASTRRCPPARTRGQPWAYKQIQSGDTTCAANQVLHAEAADLQREDRRELALRRRGRRPARPGHVREQDQGADVHGVPVGGRADRRPLPRARPALHRHDAEVVHVHQRRAHRLARSRHVQPLVRLPAAVRRAPGADRRTRRSPAPPRRSSTSRRWACRRPTSSRCRPTRSSCIPTYDARARRVQAAAAGAGAVRQRRRARARSAPRAPATRTPGSSRTSRRSRCPGTTARTWYFGAGGTLARHARRRAPASTRSPPNAHALPLTDFGTNTGDRRAVGQRVAVVVELAAEPGGHRGLVRLRAAHREHHRRRQRRGRRSGCSRRRPTSTCRPRSARCGPDGNETFVQNGWLRASERKLSTELEQHVQAAEHDARAGPDVHRGRRGADAGRPVREGRRPALLRGPRVPHRVRASG